MTVELTIIRDTSVNSRSLSSYRRIDIVQSELPVTGTLEQRGAVYNDKILVRGVYATMRAAVAAAMAYIDAPCKLIETTHWSGESEIRLVRLEAEPAFSDETDVRVLASRNNWGVNVAKAL